MKDVNRKTALLIEKLLCYGLEKDLVKERDLFLVRNQLMHLLRVEKPHPDQVPEAHFEMPESPRELLEPLIDEAFYRGVISDNNQEQRDILGARVMGILTPPPHRVSERFEKIEREQGIEAALDDFHRLCKNSYYIQDNRIFRNKKWTYESSAGVLEITINVTKPEKSPRQIAREKQDSSSSYPACKLCPSNEGYPGRIGHPCRGNLRMIPMDITDERWYFYFSPYVYYDQHCILARREHIPQEITRKTFRRLFEFLDRVPHYFIGSNADLPIVGGSILSHDHFQGGRYRFAMEKAPAEYNLKCSHFPGIKAAVIDWPATCLRLQCEDSEQLIKLSAHLLALWREYSNRYLDIISFTRRDDGTREIHNSITPIARINQKGKYEIDLVFRNNRTDPSHPDGIFHPHSYLHHIKKENIGLIEIMGLFILPGRLENELAQIKKILTGEKKLDFEKIKQDNNPLKKHARWIEELAKTHGTNLPPQQADRVIKESVGKKCLQILQHCGVFKQTTRGREAFNNFLELAGLEVGN